MARNRSVYDRARSYAFKLNPTLYKDIVHRAWLETWDRQGVDLFTKPIHYILRAVKLSYWRQHEREFEYMFKRERYHRRFLEIDPMDCTIAGGVTPDLWAECNDYRARLRDAIMKIELRNAVSVSPETLITCMTLLEQGYTRKEVAQLIGAKSQQVVDYYVKKIQWISQDLSQETE